MSYNPGVFLVEDDEIIAEGIRWLLKTVGLEMEWYKDGQSYLAAHDPARKGCLLIDVRMPVMSGLELQERLNQMKNPIPIIFITGHGDVALAVRAMQSGALNFITKPFSDQMLLDEVQKAIALSLKNNNSDELAKHHENYKKLTMREKHIFQLIIDGKLNKQIAKELDIANSTVELHRSYLMQKMEVDSLAPLVKIYLLLENANLITKVQA